MAIAGSLTYDTLIDKNGFEKGLNSLKNSVNSAGTQIKNIVTALGIDKLISASFNIISNSVDGAIKRLDTLNNYPKVMSNLGIASEDAEKSINKMSDKLSGLPTTLDEGALAVQRFTSKNSDVNKSTDYFLALNNALLAGGASADIQSSAMEQLSQAYAKGKPDMVEWRSIQTAMPAQLNQVAKAFNMTADDLGEALRNGKISMDDFMDKIVELNENGSGEFQSFEEQAKNSTGGIATSITVAKTQVVKGVADIISKIDELLRDNGLGGIGEIISNIGKKTKEALDFVSEKLPNIINVVRELTTYIEAVGIAFLSWKVGSTIQGVVQGFQKAQLALSLYSLQTNGASIAQGLLNGTLTLGETLVGLFTGKVTLAQLASAGLAKAQVALNAVMSANPIALIVLAIGMLIAVFVVLWNKCESFRDFWINLWEIVKTSFETAWSSMIIFFTETIPNAFQSLLEKISEIGNNIKTFFEELWNNIVIFFTEGIPNFITLVIEWISELPNQIGYQIGLILGHIIHFGIDTWNWIITELPLIIQGIVDWFAQLPSRVWTWLLDVINKIITWGQQSWQNAKTYTRNLIDSVTQFFSELPSKIWEHLTNIIEKVITWGTDMVNRGKEATSNLVEIVHTTISELPGKVMDVGRNIVEGLWNGICGAGDWIKGKVGEFASGVLQGMKDALGIHSPSRKARDEVGKNIPNGVAEGIKTNTDEAIKAVRKMDNEIMIEMNKAVSVEVGNMNTQATLKQAKEQPKMITNDNGININNTQNFYSKNATPYEEQKQAKQQLRRLAYGL